MPRSAGGQRTNAHGPRERSRNLKQNIYQQLRERIIFQELKAGEFLNETRLALDLGVSRTVLSEILQRLISDGLLTATPGQGVYVQGIDLLMIKSAYEMRVPLEGFSFHAGVSVASCRLRSFSLVTMCILVRRLGACPTLRHCSVIL